jgi:small subunit ribosomal protein S6
LASNVYEGMFILDSGRYARDPGGTTKQIPAVIEAGGGEVLVSRLWEERRLAYPIKGQRKGTYWLTYFRLDSQQVSGLNRQFQISDEVLRHLFVKIDPRIADTMVEHAKSGPAAKEEKKEEKKEETPVADSPAAAEKSADAVAETTDETTDKKTAGETTKETPDAAE